MLKFNRCSLSLAQNNIRNTNTYSGMIMLMSGPVPTENDLKIAMAKDGVLQNTHHVGNIGSLEFKAWVENNLSGTISAYMPVANEVKRERIGKYNFKFALSKLSTSFTVLENGASPTWFMYLTSQSASWNTDTEFRLCTYSLMGSVGDENSSADLKLFGNTLSTSVDLKANDIEIEEI